MLAGGTPLARGSRLSRRWWILLGWLFVSAMPARAALPDPPPPIELTEDEQAALAKGEIVLRLDATDQGARTVGVIDVAAPPRAVIDAVLDLPARAGEVGSIQEVSIYDHAPEAQPETLGATWNLSVVGRKVVFHTLYAIDRSRGWCVYGLDPSREHDISWSEGSYQAYTSGTGSRLVYRSTTDAGVSVPTWVRRWLVSGSLKDQLAGIKARAEQVRAGSPM